MMNHAAWADHEDSQRRFEARKKFDEKRDIEDPRLDEYGGKRLSEIMKDPALAERYMSDWSAFQ